MQKSLIALSFFIVSTAFTVPSSFQSFRAISLNAHCRNNEFSREKFLLQVSGTALFTALPIDEAFARGRGTQPAMFLRYQPRIAAFGSYLKSDVGKKIADADWTALKADVAADLKKKKGKIGPIYNGESAMSLWAASYSETFITDKSKEMQEKVDEITQFRKSLESIALKGTGDGLAKTGGFFGLGAKPEPKPSDATLQKEAKAALTKAVKAYNDYVEINNVGIPFEINPLETI
uniref:Uncharacterized protein n=1 Tax=Aureoumbra lagunensis TaxID=44058 RepID=A0A7S3K4D3_9STRA|mmetsp:Transcript_23345/g.30273  ORF Transcript_23345/g.30273 Transcript_23345/m.30273 type:complete len:234 (-) Transcript_23345:1650-2351(-)